MDCSDCPTAFEILELAAEATLRRPQRRAERPCALLALHVALGEHARHTGIQGRVRVAWAALQRELGAVTNEEVYHWSDATAAKVRAAVMRTASKSLRAHE